MKVRDYQKWIEDDGQYEERRPQKNKKQVKHNSDWEDHRREERKVKTKKRKPDNYRYD